jgi:hypothetical protein
MLYAPSTMYAVFDTAPSSVLELPVDWPPTRVPPQHTYADSAQALSRSIYHPQGARDSVWLVDRRIDPVFQNLVRSRSKVGRQSRLSFRQRTLVQHDSGSDARDTGTVFMRIVRRCVKRGGPVATQHALNSDRSTSASSDSSALFHRNVIIIDLDYKVVLKCVTLGGEAASAVASDQRRPSPAVSAGK